MINEREPGPHIVMVSRACMPKFPGYYNYYRVAVVQTVSGRTPKQINPRHKSTIYQIVRTWENVYKGSSEGCAYALAMKEANKVAEELNNV